MSCHKAKQRRNPRILDANEYEALIAASRRHPMLHLLVLLIGEAGLMGGCEALHLRWCDVDLWGGILHVARWEGGHPAKRRRVPMTARLRAAIEEFAGADLIALVGSQGWVFAHELPRPGVGAGQRVKSLSRAFRAAATDAGLNDQVWLSDMRVRRASLWLQAGHSRHLIEQVLGIACLCRKPWFLPPPTEAQLRSLVEPREES